MSTVEGAALGRSEGVRVDPREGDPPITVALAADHGLSEEEYARIRQILGRDTTFTELGIFGAMWSEQRGHKNSKRLLRLLPTEAPWVIQGTGGKPGVVDVGGGYALAFKIASRDESVMEPYQEAAHGVGSALRGIFTMGARPMAILDSLRFGDLDSARARDLFRGVVTGVGDFSHGVGIPDIGGDVIFDRGYEGSALVNVMCVGLMKIDDLTTRSAGVGDLLMAVGAVSQDAGEVSRPQVPVGEPSTGKLLLEASLELMESGAILGIHDLGVAGITSIASELAGRAGGGVEIEMAAVPVPGMSPREILLSEWQDHVLVVAEQGKEHVVHEILQNRELEGAEVGRVTDDGRFRVLENGVTVADVPALPLTQGCPTYEREGIENEEIQTLRGTDLTEYATPEGDLSQLFLEVLGSPNVASKQWVHHRHEGSVRTSSAAVPGGDGGVVLIPGTRRAVAATVECNGRFVYLDPGRGARIAVAESARNLVCVGAVPTAVTHCLNFGNPLRADIYYQFREAVLGMGEACRVFETPVTGGAVSFYNENDGVAIYPTPGIGMVGVVEDVDHITPQAFQEEGDAVILLGENTDELGGSEYLYAIHEVAAGAPPEVDLLTERSLQQAVLAMIQDGLVRSAHDCSDGGLACTLAESCFGDGANGHGLDVELDDALPPVAVLFGEAQGRVVVSCHQDDQDALLSKAAAYGVAARRIGTVGEEGGALRIEVAGANVAADAAALAEVYFGAIPGIMDTPRTAGA